MFKIFTAIILLCLILFQTACSDQEPAQDRVTRITSPFYKQNSDDPLENPNIPVPPDEPKNINIKFLAAGDNIIHSNIYEDAYERARDDTPEYNFYDMYTDIADFVASADIAFVNQETPIAGKEFGYSGYPNFNSPNEAGDALVDLGFNIVNIANNHMLDKWEAGLRKYIEYWENKDVLLLGAFHNAEDYDKIRIYEEQGVKIAFLSYTYGTNGMTLPAGSELIIPLPSDQVLTRQINLAKEIGDLVFVSIHWGEEDWFKPSDNQKHYANLMVDLGVDVVIGHHSHVVQPIEWAENTEGNKTLIIYSLGNLISTMLYSRNMVGGIVTFDIIKEGNEKPYIANPLYTPVMCHYSMTRRGLQVYLLENYSEELALQHGAQKNGKFTLETLKSYVTSTITAEFLPDFYK